jgi:hypothetical protein
MRLRQLFESGHAKADAAFCFGRFNPPHQGHAEVWSAVKNSAHKWYIGTNPTTIGPNDPLAFNTKTAWMTAIDPEIEGHILGETSVLTLAARIFSHLGEGVTIGYVTDETDWAWAGKLLHQYNGQKSLHGYFNFKGIIHIPSPRVMSATKLREAARAGNEELFYQLAGVDPELKVHGKSFFETVAEACGQHPIKAKKVKKEKAVVQELNSIKYANKVLREMKLRELFREGKVTDVHPDHDAVHQGGVSRSRDVGGYDRVYHMNRLMMAMAMANGKDTKAVDSPESTWVEKFNTHHPYTKEEHNMIHSAFKTVPTDKEEISPWEKSEEPKDTNIVSPVAKSKKNKYGI